MTETKEKNGHKKPIAEAVVIITIVVFIVLIILLLTHKKEAHIIDEHKDDDVVALVCTLDENIDSTFFNSETATSVKHVVKATYNNGSIDKMSYEYKGDYESKDAAEHDDAVLHANYNYYMGERGEKSESLTPVFQVVDNKLTIKLYLDRYKDINSTTGRLFYIGSGLEDIIGRNSVEDTEKYFERKSFSCIIDE